MDYKKLFDEIVQHCLETGNDALLDFMQSYFNERGYVIDLTILKNVTDKINGIGMKMKPEIVKQIQPDVALEIMNDLVLIHNLMLTDDQRCAFYHLGVMVGSLAERVRNEDKQA